MTMLLVARALEALLTPEARRHYHEASRRLPRHGDVARIVDTILRRAPAPSAAR